MVNLVAAALMIVVDVLYNFWLFEESRLWLAKISALVGKDILFYFIVLSDALWAWCDWLIIDWLILFDMIDWLIDWLNLLDWWVRTVQYNSWYSTTVDYVVTEFQSDIHPQANHAGRSKLPFPRSFPQQFNIYTSRMLCGFREGHFAPSHMICLGVNSWLEFRSTHDCWLRS